MTDSQSKTPGPIVRYGLVAYLIGSFLWRVLTPAHEYPGRSATYLEIALDILVMVGLIGDQSQGSEAAVLDCARRRRGDVRSSA